MELRWNIKLLKQERINHLKVMKEYLQKYKQTGDNWWLECAKGRGRLSNNIKKLLHETS